MTYLEELENRFDEIVSNIIDTNESVINRFNIESINGETLDLFGKIHGVERMKISDSHIYETIIQISFKEEVTEFLIPINSKFYINDESYFITYNDTLFSGTNVTLDCILTTSLSKNKEIPVTMITKVDSDNTTLNSADQIIKTTRNISFSSTNESDSDYKTRIIQYCSGRNINQYDQLKYILSTVNVTDYVFIKDGVYSGTIEVVIAPPEIEQYELYKSKIDNMTLHMFNSKQLRIIIKPPFIRNFKISSYTSVPSEFIQMINSLPMGSSINMSQVKSYCGETTVAFMDEDEFKTKVQLNKYEKARLIY